MVQARQHGAFDDDTKDTHDQRCHNQSGPIANAQIVQQHPRDKGTCHVQRAMGKVDDVQKAKDNRKAQR